MDFPMGCLGIKAKRERGKGVLKRMLTIRMLMQEGRGFIDLIDLIRQSYSIILSITLHSSFHFE